MANPYTRHVELKWWQKGWFAYFGAATVVGAPATAAWLVRGSIGRGFDALLLAVLVAVAARIWGTGPGLLAAAVAFFALGAVGTPLFFNVHPDTPAEWVETAVFLVAVVLLAFQVGSLRDSETTALMGQREAGTLARLTAALVPDTRLEDVADEVVSSLKDLTGAATVTLLMPDARGTLTAVGQSGQVSDSSDLATGELVDYAWEHAVAIGLPDVAGGDEVVEGWPVSASAARATPDTPDRKDLVLPFLNTEQVPEGLLHVGPRSDGRAYDPAMAGRLVLVSRLIAVYVERHRLQEVAARAQATTEAEKLRASLVSSVSHELKTPLASINATVTGLLDETHQDPARVRAELASVAEDVHRLNRSISDLLDFSRLETEEWRPVKDWHDLADVAGSAIADLPERDLGRIVIDAPDEPVLVYVDFVQLSRAVYHLVENALAYSSADRRVVISVAETDGWAQVAVTDNGPGVTESERDRVFEKFYRGSASAAVPHGTGLGLSIVREVVARHDGRLRVESVKPSGARFVLELPFSRENTPNTPSCEDEEAT